MTQPQYLAAWWDATDEDLRWGHDGIAPPYAIYFRKPVGGMMCLMAIEDPSFQQHLTILARVALEAWRNYHQEMERGDG